MHTGPTSSDSHSHSMDMDKAVELEGTLAGPS